MFNSQHVNNDPNPVLVAFREDTYAKGTVKEATCVLNYWALYLRVLGQQEIEVTEGAKDHARKVLTRLVNVYGGQNDKH